MKKEKIYSFNANKIPPFSSHEIVPLNEGPGVEDGAGVGRGGLRGAAGGKWSLLRYNQHHCHAKPNLGQLSRGEQITPNQTWGSCPEVSRP